MANFIGRRIRIITGEGGRTYEGYVHLLDQNTGQISLLRVVIPETGKKLNGLQTFFGADISSIEVLEEECKKVENDDNIISEKRERGPRLLHSKYVPGHLDKLKDFEPSKHLLRTVVKDHGTGDRTENVPKPVNKSSDYDSSSDQDTLDYEDCIYLSKINQRFHDAINHLRDQSEIGVSFSGVCIGRDGKLSLIQMATSIDVFVFDIVALGHNCWDEGLKSIFQSPSVSKVIHDCRFPSDMLHHQYSVSLINIFDTQVAEVFVYRLYHTGSWPKWVNGLSCSLFDHLNLSTDMVNNLKIRENLKKEDQIVWMNRPIPKNLLKVAIKEVVHLLQLRHMLTEKMMGEYIAGVDVYLAQVREASKEDVKKYQHNAHKLPVAFENLSGLLARRDSRRYNRHRYHRGPPDDHDFHKDNNGFRENCRGFVGVNVRFSNSSIWHEGGIFESKSNKDKVDISEKLPTKSENSEIPSSNLPQITTSLLKNPPSVLEKLRMATLSEKKENLCDNKSSNDNVADDKAANQSPSLSCDNSNQEMSVGRLIRSSIKYRYDSDIDLVPAGIMLQNDNLKKVKQKRLSEIDQMTNQMEEMKNKMDNSVDRRHYDGDMNVSSTDSQKFSFDEKYTTAYTSPDQSLFEVSRFSARTSLSPNISLNEHYKTAPSTPEMFTRPTAESFEDSASLSSHVHKDSNMSKLLKPSPAADSQSRMEEMYRSMPKMTRIGESPKCPQSSLPYEKNVSPTTTELSPFSGESLKRLQSSPSFEKNISPVTSELSPFEESPKCPQSSLPYEKSELSPFGPTPSSLSQSLENKAVGKNNNSFSESPPSLSISDKLKLTTHNIDRCKLLKEALKKKKAKVEI